MTALGHVALGFAGGVTFTLAILRTSRPRRPRTPLLRIDGPPRDYGDAA